MNETRVAPTQHDRLIQALPRFCGATALTVLRWDLRRFIQQPLGWVALILMLILAVATVWGGTGRCRLADHLPAAPLSHCGASALIWRPLFWVQVVWIPFVTNLITRDRQQDVHDLLMATALPSRAYLLGRWGVGVVMIAGLSILTSAGGLITGWMLHMWEPAVYQRPLSGAVVQAWIRIAPFWSLVVVTLSFAVGTLARRAPQVAAAGITVLWYTLMFASPLLLSDEQLTWAPMYLVIEEHAQSPYYVAFHQAAAGADLQRQQQVAITVLSNASILEPWLKPYVWGIPAVLALLLLLVTFKRGQAHARLTKTEKEQSYGNLAA